MKKTLFLIYLFSIISLNFVLYAQDLNKITGNVKDAVTNEDLIGVNILISGTSTGTVTDVNGNFSLSVPLNGGIKLSYIGYKEQEIKIEGLKVLAIKMVSESEQMDEVVVVGYSVQKKRDVLGAISKVSSDDLEKIPVASAQLALQGRVAGVQVSS